MTAGDARFGAEVRVVKLGATRARRRVGARLLACALVVLAACGNRLSHEEILAQNGLTPAGQARVAAGTSGAANATTGLVGTGDAASSGVGTASGGTGTGQSAAGETSGGDAAAQGTKAPLVIGMVGWLSGIGGQTSTYARDTLVAWSKAVNARGGINGHPVQLLIADDGGNESRSVSIVQDFVENKKALAIVYYSGGSAVGVSNYAKSKGVPIIGGNIIEPVWTQNPMLFPTNAATDGHFWGAARLLKNAGVQKVATVFCTEVAACGQSNDTFIRYAKEEGLDVVYQGRISFTQPDYTADCLQMRNAGAQAVVPITENSSTVRLAQSCGRQDYKPIYDLQAVNDGMAQIPEFDNAIGNLATFPWFLHSGSPAIDEYVAALQQYAPNAATYGVDVQSGGWLAGKLFEQAAQGVSDNPTTQEILDGLWKMNGETLGGLLQGGEARTFTQGQPTAETFCVYSTRIQGGAWTAPDGLTPVCR
jgi:branched-chain amino acid transport system substrate-binding protein